MQMRHLGDLWPVSVLTLGGGGIGQLWGRTTRDECVATVRAAVDAGITLLDMAPAYGNGEAESVVGAAFDGRLPAGIRVTTKHRLGSPPVEEVEARVMRGLEESFARMRLSFVDVLFLHSNIVPDDYDASAYERIGRPATRWRTYVEGLVPVLEKMVAQGCIGAWGITGIGIPDQVTAALAGTPKPAVVQCIANAMDSAGELKQFAGPARPREILAAAKANGVGVMGIRAVQGGALTDTLDRPLPDDHGVVADYRRAAPFRAIAAEHGVSAAALAHRYALSMDGVDTIVLGVKNRAELADCVAAAAAGPLDAATVARIDAGVGRV